MTSEQKQKLFGYFAQEYGINLLDGDFNEIDHILGLSDHLPEPGKMIGAVYQEPEGLLSRAIRYVKTQKEIDIPEGWESILGLLCAKFYEHEKKEETK